MWPGPYGEWGSRKYLVSSLDQSLQRMGLDYVDIFYHHRPDPDTPLEETMTALDAVVRAGKAQYVGISNYTSEQTAQAAAILQELGTPLLIHQPSYSILNRWIEKDHLLDTLERVGAGCIAFSPLQQGLLTDRYLGGIPDDSRMRTSVFLNEDALDNNTLARLHALNDIAKRRGQSLAQTALRVGVARPAHDQPDHRRQQRGAAGDQRRRPGQPHPVPDRAGRHRRHRPGPVTDPVETTDPAVVVGSRAYGLDGPASDHDRGACRRPDRLCLARSTSPPPTSTASERFSWELELEMWRGAPRVHRPRILGIRTDGRNRSTLIGMTAPTVHLARPTGPCWWPGPCTN